MGNGRRKWESVVENGKRSQKIGEECLSRGGAIENSENNENSVEGKQEKRSQKMRNTCQCLEGDTENGEGDRKKKLLIENGEQENQCIGEPQIKTKIGSKEKEEKREKTRKERKQEKEENKKNKHEKRKEKKKIDNNRKKTRKERK